MTIKSPKISWHKELKSQSSDDSKWLSLLAEMEKGVLLPLDIWAKAGGVDPKDLKLKKD